MSLVFKKAGSPFWIKCWNLQEMKCMRENFDHNRNGQQILRTFTKVCPSFSIDNFELIAVYVIYRAV